MVITLRNQSTARTIEGGMETTLKGLHFYSPYGRVGVQVMYDPDEPLQSSFSVSHNDVDYSDLATDRLEYGDDLYLKTSLTAMENQYYVDVKGEQVCITGKTSDFCDDDIEGLFGYSAISNAGGLTLDSSNCYEAFAYCTNLTVAPIITKDVTSLQATFMGCSNLKYVDISALDSSTLSGVNFTDMCTNCYPDGWLKVAPDTTKAQLEALDDEIPANWIIFGFEYDDIKTFTAYAHETYIDCDLALYDGMATEVIEWQLSTDPTFAKVIDSGTWNVTSSVENQFVNDGLTVNTIYYVRARIAFEDGTYSSWVSSSVITRYNYFSITNPSEAESDLTVSLTLVGGDSYFDYEISTDNETWEPWTVTSSVMTETVGIGDTIYLRATNLNTYSSSRYSQFSFDGDATFGGSITAIRRKEYNDDSLGAYQFYRLFKGCTTITSAPKLYSTGTFGDYAYSEMFNGCTGLATMPQWANNGSTAQNLFNATFSGCTSLQTMLPFSMSNSETLAVGQMMQCFSGCTGLQSVEDFSSLATIGTAGLKQCFMGCRALSVGADMPLLSSVSNDSLYQCYSNSGLTSAIDVPSLATVGKFSFARCYEGCTSLLDGGDYSSVTSVLMDGFYNAYSGCTSMTTAPDLSGLTTVGDSGMVQTFVNCSSLAVGVDLRNVTSIGRVGMENLYRNCSALNTAYAPNLSAWDETKMKNWLYGVAASGTVYKPAAISLPAGVNGVPSGWTTEDY